MIIGSQVRISSHLVGDIPEVRLSVMDKLPLLKSQFNTAALFVGVGKDVPRVRSVAGIVIRPLCRPLEL